MSPPLVLLHGWGMSARVWAPLTSALSGYGILTPDLPGHGSAPAVGNATLAAWSARMAATLPPAATVCGWSLGALVALDLAIHYPERVRRLVMIGGTPRFVGGTDWPHGLGADTVTAFRREFTNEPATVLRRFRALQVLGDARRRDTGARLEEALSAVTPNAAQTAALAEGLTILAGSDLRADVARVTQPALLIHGAHDALMPVGAAHWLAGALPAARLEVFGDCGHAPLLAHAADCAALLRDFARD